MRRSLLLSIIFFLGTPLSEGQVVVRTWVSSTGSDANPCTRSLPCRNFVVGIAAVSPGGEVVALDSAGYGPVAINKSVSLISPEGVHAAIAPTAGTAIQVSGGRVSLRNLYLKGNGAFIGLEVVSPDTTIAESLTIDGFGSFGIAVQASELFLYDCAVRNNAENGLSAAGNGVGELAILTIDGCRFEKNGGTGVFASSFASASIRDTVAASNVFSGFGAGSLARISLMNCQASSNTYGVYSDGMGAFVRMSQSAAVHNIFGLFETNGGAIETQGNNFVQGNDTQNVFGTITTFSGT